MTELGRIFDRKYRLTRLLGEGGMGTVYEAEHTLIQRSVAVKVMHSEFATSIEICSRFVREAQAASSIGHPNIVEIYDVGTEEDGTIFIVMELLQGSNLKNILREQKKLSPPFAVFVSLQVLSALAAAHQKGIIHRDIKPDNIYLCRDPQGRQIVKILDFGIAKVQGALEGDQGLTKTGTVLGTPHYMSPEQARGINIDHRIDIWSMGVILYEMLSGLLPYPGDTYNNIMGKILLEVPSPLRQLEPGLSDALVAIVEKAMCKDLAGRYCDAAAMISDLLPLSDGAQEMPQRVSLALKNSIAPRAMSHADTMVAPPERQNKELSAAGDVSIRKKSPRRAASVLLKIAVGLAAFVTLLIVSDDAARFYFDRSVNWVQNNLLKEPLQVIDPVVVNVPRKNEPVENQQTDSSVAVVPEPALPSAPEPTPAVRSIADHKGAPGSKVTIALAGLPKQARIFASSKRVESPFQLPQSNKMTALKITAPGYLPYTKKIVPNRDQHFKIAMKKKP